MFMVTKKHPQNWVRHYRKIKGYSAQELGDIIGMSKEGITYIERRERALTLIKAKSIAKALNVDLIEIVEGPRDEVTPSNQKEKKLLETYRGMNEQDQQRFIQMGDIYAGKKEK